MVPKTTFEVLFEDEVASFAAPNEHLVGNENLLSLANGFEEGKWRYACFSTFIWNNIQETALTQREREAFAGNPMTVLQQAARRLRLCDDNGKGSEIAEIFLYGIMRHHYRALSAVPKIFHKQNRNDNAKGADSVHVVVRNGGEVELWLGEAKFYEKITSSLFAKFIDSVSNTLDQVAVRKENSIILGMPDLKECLKKELPEQAEQVFEKIKGILSPDTSLDEIKRILHVPILLIDECQITKASIVFDEQYREAIRAFHKKRAVEYFSLQGQLLKENVCHYSQIKFHLILFPIPDKKTIINDFFDKARMLRGEGK